MGKLVRKRVRFLVRTTAVLCRSSAIERESVGTDQRSRTLLLSQLTGTRCDRGRGRGVTEQPPALLLPESGTPASGLPESVGAARLRLVWGDGVGGDRPYRPAAGDRAEHDFVAAQPDQVAVV